MKLKLTSFDDIETIIEDSFSASGDGCGYIDADKLAEELLKRTEDFFKGDDNE
tara:strand:- start:973 stop:1131 length:159 start_codon:yes stop_codon:yes gene_type:complete